MNILFISISGIPHTSEHTISLDLIRELEKKGHKVYIVCSNERRNNQPTNLSVEEDIDILRVKILNNKNTNLIEKGFSNLLLPHQYNRAIKKHYKNVKFDLVLYPTPPVTQVKTVKYIKKRDNAKSYLLLKDIFPQNAVDIGMMTKTGVKSVIYKMFRKKEEKLYKISDFIGCMSQANVDYLIKHNPYIDPSKVHINPNSVEVLDVIKSEESKNRIKEKYNIPKDAKTFIYGGNLGRPQDILFVIKCLKANANKKDRFFIISGKGTEYPKLKAYIDSEKPSNVLLINGLPRAEYEEFVKAFDVGLVFLDKRFTIPNFPSRILSYMQNSMPVIASTDVNTDMGEIIKKGEFGWWCESRNSDDFTSIIDEAVKSDLNKKGENARKYLIDNYTAERSCNIILSHTEA